MVEGIEQDGVLWPRPQIRLPVNVVWLTDLAEPDRDALGLTSTMLSCDRTEYRVTVAPEAVGAAVWWPVWSRRVEREIREAYEDAAPGLRPVHWWVSEVPVPVASVEPVHCPVRAR